MIFLKSKAGRRCEVMTGKTAHVGYLLLSRLTSLTRNGQTAQRFESSGGHKEQNPDGLGESRIVNSVNKGNGRVTALPESPKQKEKMDMKAMMRIAFAVAMLALVAVIVVMVVRTWWAQGGQNIGQLVAALVFYGAGGGAIWYTGDSALRKEK